MIDGTRNPASEPSFFCSNSNTPFDNFKSTGVFYIKTFSTATKTIDFAGKNTRAKAVIYIHHRDARRAAV